MIVFKLLMEYETKIKTELKEKTHKNKLHNIFSYQVQTDDDFKSPIISVECNSQKEKTIVVTKHVQFKAIF